MTDRVFLPWDEAALPRAARILVEHHAPGAEGSGAAGGGEGRTGATGPVHSGDGGIELSGDAREPEGLHPRELRMDRTVAALPGRRAGRRLMELLVEEAGSRGLPLVPPRVVTVGALPELLYDPPAPLADPVLSRRVWAAVLADLPPDRLEVLVPEPPRPDDLPGWHGLADRVHRLQVELGREGRIFQDVVESCRSGELLFDDSARWELLARARSRYLARLEALGRVDREEARRRAARNDGSRPETDPELLHVYLVGVVDLPGVLRDMLHLLDTPVTALVHAPPERAGDFDELGCVRTEEWTEARVPIPDEILAFRDRPGDQATEALRAVASFEGRFAPDEITVGAPDDSVIPYLEQRFSAYDLPHRSALGTPLERTAPFRLLEAAADFVDGRSFRDLGALLRHPDLEGLLGKPPSLGVMDEFFSERLPSRMDPVPPGRPPWKDQGAEDSHRDPGIFETTMDLMRRLDNEDGLGRLAGRRRLTEWMPEILALLERAYGARPLDRGSPPDRLRIEALIRIRDGASSLRRLPPELDPECTAAAGIRILLAELADPDSAIPPEADLAAVELLGWLELHLDDAPALVLTGANEPHLPESLNADPFLPDTLRSRLGLTDNRRRYARDAYLLTTLLRSRDEIRLVAGRRDGDGDPLRPSRLLFADEDERAARRVLRFTGGEDDPDAPLPPLGLQPAPSSSFRAPPEPLLSLSPPPERLRVTDFGPLLRDPYRWVLERRMELKEVHDRARELDPLAFGTLAHGVLEEFGASAEVNVPDAEAVSRRIGSILDRMVRRRFHRPALPAVAVQVEQLRFRLQEFARWHAEWIRKGWRVVATEARTRPDGVSFPVDDDPVFLTGRIDRIDVHEETGQLAVFDYKTGDSATSPDSRHRTRSGEWRDLQLPLYRHLLFDLVTRERAPVDLPPAEGGIRLGYIHLPKSREKVGRDFADWDPEELESADEAAREVVRWLREEPEIPFDAASATFSPWDPFTALLGGGVVALHGWEGEEEEEP